MADQKSNLIRREEVVEGTMAFHFEKPPGFTFKAGQSADVTLIDPPDTDAEGTTRTFSIASPPFEAGTRVLRPHFPLHGGGRRTGFRRY
jgi:ferredoxin-NADP reductase